jgi:hypothetical protein
MKKFNVLKSLNIFLGIYGDFVQKCPIGNFKIILSLKILVWIRTRLDPDSAKYLTPDPDSVDPDSVNPDPVNSDP